jgi:hypothetical protein
VRKGKSPPTLEREAGRGFVFRSFLVSKFTGFRGLITDLELFGTIEHEELIKVPKNPNFPKQTVAT